LELEKQEMTPELSRVEIETILKLLPAEYAKLPAETRELFEKAKKQHLDTQKLYMLRFKKLFKTIGPKWCANMRRNIHFPGVRSDHQMHHVPLSPQATHGRRAWLFASGASLQQYESTLPELVGNDFVAVTPTQAPWFVYHAKRKPDVVIAIDMSEKMLLECNVAGLKGLPLIIATTGSNDLVRYFAPEVYWFTSLVAWPGDPDEFEYNQILDWVFAEMHVRILQMGCVTNEAMMLVATLMNFKRLDARHLILAGADYAFYHELARVPSGYRDEDGKLQMNDYIRYDQEAGAIDIIDWRGMKTNSRMLSYTREMVEAWAYRDSPMWKPAQPKVWRLGENKDESILGDLIPMVTSEQLKTEEYPEYPSNEEIMEIWKDYSHEFTSGYASKIGYDSDVMTDENVVSKNDVGLAALQDPGQ